MAIGYDDVIHEVNTHGLTSLDKGFGEMIIIRTWLEGAAWMVVTESHHCCVSQNSLLHGNADIDGGFCDTSASNQDPLNEVEVLIQQNDV